MKLNSGQFHLKYEKIKSDLTAHCITYYLYYIYYPETVKLLPKNCDERLINKWTISASLYFSRHFTKTFIKPSVENIMNRAQMEHYKILKTSLERFGKCQWNIKVYKRNRLIAASFECFPEARNIVIEETDRSEKKY